MKILLDRLQNGEYIQFLNDTLAFINEEQTVASELTDQMNVLTNQVAKLEKVFKVRGHELTAKIKEADDKRDQAFIGIKNVVKGYQSHLNPVLAEHARRVMHLLTRYGLNIFNLNYQAETENLTVLVAELNDLETNESVLTSLNIKNWVDDLKLLNENFNTLHRKRTASYTELGLRSVTSARDETNAMYFNLVRLLDALVLTKKAKGEDVSAFEGVQQKLEESGKQFMELVQLRRSKAQDDDEEPDTPEMD